MTPPIAGAMNASVVVNLKSTGEAVWMTAWQPLTASSKTPGPVMFEITTCCRGRGEMDA